MEAARRYGTLPATRGRDRDERKAPVQDRFGAAQPQECRDESFRLNRAIMQSRSILGVWVLLFFTDCAT